MITRILYTCKGCCCTELHCHIFLVQERLWLKCIATVLILFILPLTHLSGQDIILQNGSLEGKPQRGAVPKPWYIFSNSPDTQPGFETILPASDGKTYVGALYGNDYYERLAQDLGISLKPGKIYCLSFDLAYPPYYTKNICNGSFAIYGANLNETPVLLWESGAFYHTGWKTYNAVLKPQKEYQQIIMGPNYVAACSACNCSATAVLIDNFSAAIREMPQVEVNVQNTCTGKEKGAAAVTIKSGVPPFRYLWSTDIHAENHENSELHNLKAGAYEVKVISANGLETIANFYIHDMDVQVTPEVSPPSCYGYKDAVVLLAVTEGAPPYNYEMNYGAVIQNKPAFTQLTGGQYDFKVMDARGCITTIQNVEITEPQPLQVSVIDPQEVCNDIRRRKIIINSTGGSPPYSYKLNQSGWQTGNIFEQLPPGKYVYYAIDKNKCEVSDKTEIKKNIQPCAIFMPNAFSPNGDGLNDIFRAKIHDDIHDFTMEVYNRYGQRVYLSHNPREGWSGARESTGTYIWTITYTDSKSQARKQQGSVILIR